MSVSSGVQPPASLSQRLRKAGAWIIAGHLATQLIRFGSNLVLARFLAPEAFGILSVVYILVIGLGLFSDLGIGTSVIRSHRGGDPAFLKTAWSLQVLRGGVISAGCLLLALVIHLVALAGWVKPGSVYADPRLPMAVAAFSIDALLVGLQSMRLIIARREMRRERITLIDLTCQISAMLVMVAIAWSTHSFWALVAGAITASGVRLLLQNLWLPGPKDGWMLERTAMAEILGHAKWLLPGSILGFMAINGDRFLLGGMLDARSFGLYSLAFLLANTFQVIASSMIGETVLPALSEVNRRNPEDLRRVWVRFQWVYDAAFVTLGACLAACGPAVVKLLYAASFADAGPMLAALGWGMVGLRNQITEQLYLVKEQMQLVAVNQFLRLIAVGAGVLIGFRMGGIAGAVWGVVLSQFAGWPLALWFRIRHGLWDWRSEWLLLPAIAAGSLLGWGFQTLAG